MFQYFVETSEPHVRYIFKCDVIYYVIYFICPHYFRKAISPLFAWARQYY